MPFEACRPFLIEARHSQLSKRRVHRYMTHSSIANLHIHIHIHPPTHHGQFTYTDPDLRLRLDLILTRVCGLVNW